MSNTNDVTGDKLISKVGNSQAFNEGYDRIFGNKDKPAADNNTTDSKKCECPNWTLGCCGAGTKIEDK